MPCKCVKLKRDGDAFVIKIDKTKLTAADQGFYIYTVLLKDDSGVQSEFVTAEQQIVINYVPLPQEEEPEEVIGKE